MLPVSKDKGERWQGLEGWLVDLLKQALARSPIAMHHSAIQPLESLGKGRIECGEISELLMA